MRQSKGLLPAAGTANSGTKWSGTIFIAGDGSRPSGTKDGRYAASAVPFSSSTGIGANIERLDDYQNGIAYSVSVHPNQTDVAFAWGTSRTSTPLTAKKFSTATGWYGTRFTTGPSDDIGATAMTCCFSPVTGNYIAVGGGSGAGAPPSVMPYSTTTGFGPKFVTPSGFLHPFGTPIYGITFSPDEKVIACATSDGSCIAYKWSAAGWGTRYSDPPGVESITQISTAVAFSPNGDAIAITNWQSPGIFVWKWSNDTGFGTKYSDPIGSNGQQWYGVAWNSDGDEIAYVGQMGSAIHVYPWSSTSGFGTKYANPAILPAVNNSRGVAWTPNNSDIFLGTLTTRGMEGYEWKKGVGFGKKHPKVQGSYNSVHGIAMGPST